MKQKDLPCYVNAHSTVQHVIQIKNGIMKHANANVKTIKCAAKAPVGILGNVFVKMVNI